MYNNDIVKTGITANLNENGSTSATQLMAVNDYCSSNVEKQALRRWILNYFGLPMVSRIAVSLSCFVPSLYWTDEQKANSARLAKLVHTVH